MPSNSYSGTSPDTSDLRTAASDLGQRAGEQLDSGRNAAAGGLASAADSLHQHAGDLPGGTRVANFAHGTADKLSLTADYIRAHDVGEMFQDVQSLIKKNPVPALLGAAAIGFLLAKAFSRD